MHARTSHRSVKVHDHLQSRKGAMYHRKGMEGDGRGWKAMEGDDDLDTMIRVIERSED